MLTKEAFNALLKTLEEPPPKVKFFFATTEAHKVLPTILSRCQRFNLSRIPLSQIISKLTFIAQRLQIEIEEEALQLLAQRAEGGLRDAESLFDQIVAFSEGKIRLATVQSILGLMPREAYFELDLAGKEGNFTKAFEIAHQVFTEGKDLNHFIEGLIDHFRHILLIQLAGIHSPLLTISAKDKEFYEKAAQLYTQEQCLDLIDYLIESAQQIRFANSGKMALEAILLHVIRSHFRLPIEVLVRRLGELEQAVGESDTPPPSTSLPKPTPSLTTATIQIQNSSNTIVPTKSSALPSNSTEKKPDPLLFPSSTTFVQTSHQIVPNNPISEDPTPSQADLGLSKTTQPYKTQKPLEAKQLNTNNQTPTHQYDTLFQFAMVELEGQLQRKA
jgi:DNA polymerase-3 subunit gamma/tau